MNRKQMLVLVCTLVIVSALAYYWEPINLAAWAHPLGVLVLTGVLTLVCLVQAAWLTHRSNRKRMSAPALRRPSYGPLMQDSNAWLASLVAQAHADMLAGRCIGTPDGIHVLGWSPEGTCVACMPTHHHA